MGVVGIGWGYCLREGEVMPITPQQRTIHRNFIIREKRHERKYARLFLSALSRQFRAAAKQYAETGSFTVDDSMLEPIFRRLYVEIMPTEAELSWEIFVAPLASDQKDILDSLASLLGISSTRGERIRLWRRMAEEYINTWILTKISQVSNTTQKSIAAVVERGINEGKGVRDIAKDIRTESGGEINKNRSRLIARTETIGAMNRGKRLSMATSNLEWEKKWIPFVDEKTRVSHRGMSSKGFIPFDQPYVLSNGDNMMYPGDPNGSAANVCNCRCTEVYQVVRGADGRPLRKS